MKSKITLSLSQEAIEKAENFAKIKNTSISKLVENYISTLSFESKVVQKKGRFFVGLLRDSEYSKMTKKQLRELYAKEKMVE